ncbi:MAG: CAP domain-containing protein [Lachnospiraceae bacterium]|nr:CAP domain-containing protein [Lachnospiraceae bacterium]
MRKVSVCAMAAALLVATGGVSEAQAAVVSIKGTQIQCSTIEELKDKLQQMNIGCDNIRDLLSQMGCGNLPGAEKPDYPETPEENVPGQPETPEENVPEQPETPEENVPEQPGTPDGNVPILPEVPELPEEKPEEQDIAYVYGMRITELVNEHRAAAGLAPVVYSASLSKAAQVRSVEIEKSFSHTRPDGRYFASVLQDHGISYHYAGENIAWGQKSPEEVVTAWMNSAGHRANILNKNFKELGVGYRQNSKGVNYFTQLFIY